MKDKIEILSKRLGYKSKARYLHRANSVFKGFDFSNKKVLDVGCGKGTWSFWAKIQGADEVCGLEPELDGATKGTRDKFNEIKKELDFDDSIMVLDAMVQNLDVSKKYDVIILYNVINHLDEDSVVHFPNNPDSFNNLVKLATFLKSLMNPNGTIIFTDSARENYFNTVGLKSPLAKTIEWHKHLEPRDWIRVFETAGFVDKQLSWAALYPLGKYSSFEFLQRFVGSGFILKFKKLPS